MFYKNSFRSCIVLQTIVVQFKNLMWSRGFEAFNPCMCNETLLEMWWIFLLIAIYWIMDTTFNHSYLPKIINRKQNTASFFAYHSTHIHIYNFTNIGSHWKMLKSLRHLLISDHSFLNLNSSVFAMDVVQICQNL